MMGEKTISRISSFGSAFLLLSSPSRILYSVKTNRTCPRSMRAKSAVFALPYSMPNRAYPSIPASNPVVRKGTKRDGIRKTFMATFPSAQPARQIRNISSGITISMKVYCVVAKAFSSTAGSVIFTTTFFSALTPSREISAFLRQSIPMPSITSTGSTVCRTPMILSIACLPFQSFFGCLCSFYNTERVDLQSVFLYKK